MKQVLITAVIILTLVAAVIAMFGQLPVLKEPEPMYIPKSHLIDMGIVDKVKDAEERYRIIKSMTAEEYRYVEQLKREKELRRIADHN